jgi:hypothetical protein
MEDPALKIWHALNVLAEIPKDSATSDKILAAEMLLLNLMLELFEIAEQSSPKSHNYTTTGSTIH